MSDFTKNIEEAKSIVTNYEHQLTGPQKKAYTKKTSYTIEDLKAKLSAFESLWQEVALLMLANLEIFGEYVLETLTLTDEQRSELEKLKEISLELNKSAQEQEDLKEEVDVDTDKPWLMKRVWDNHIRKEGASGWEKAGRTLLFATVVWAAWYGVVKYFKKDNRKKRKLRRQKNREKRRKRKQEKRENPGFRQHTWGKRIKWVGAGLLAVGVWVWTFFGIKKLKEKFPDLKINLNLETKKEKKAGQKQANEWASDIVDLEFDKNKDEYVFSYQEYNKTASRADIKTNEDLQTRVDETKIEIEWQIQALKWASQIDGMEFDLDNNEYQYTVEPVTKKTSMLSIESFEDLQKWKTEQDTKIAKKRKKHIEHKDIREKLNNDSNYLIDCETVWDNVNTYFDIADANHNPLWTSSFEKLDTKWENLTSWFIIAWIDQIYGTVDSFVEEDTLKDLKKDADISSFANMWKKFSTRTLIFLLTSLRDSIPEVEHIDLDLWFLWEIDLTDDIDQINNKWREKLTNTIWRIEKDYKNYFDDLEKIFMKQMQVMTYLSQVEETLWYEIGIKIILKEDPNAFNNIDNKEDKYDIVDERIEKDNDLEEAVFVPKLKAAMAENFHNKSITELVSDTSTPYHDQVQEILANPIGDWTMEQIEGINKKQEKTDEEFEKILEEYDDKKAKKLANNFINNVEWYYHDTWRNIFRETRWEVLGTENADTENMIEQFFDTDTIKEQTKTAQKILDDIKAWKKPSQEQLLSLQDAYKQFYKTQKQHELFGKVVFDVEKDDKWNIYFRWLHNYGKGISRWKWMTMKLWNKDYEKNKWQKFMTVVASILTIDTLTYIPAKIIKTVWRFSTNKWIKNSNLRWSPTDYALRWLNKLTRAQQLIRPSDVLRPVTARKSRSLIKTHKLYTPKTNSTKALDYAKNKLAYDTFFNPRKQIPLDRTAFFLRRNELLVKEFWEHSVLGKHLLFDRFLKWDIADIDNVKMNTIWDFVEQDQSLVRRWLIINHENKFWDREYIKKWFTEPWQRHIYSLSEEAYNNLKTIKDIPENSVDTKYFYKGMLQWAENIGGDEFTKVVSRAWSLDKETLAILNSKNLDVVTFGRELAEWKHKAAWKILQDDNLFKTVKEIDKSFFSASNKLTKNILTDNVLKKIKDQAEKNVKTQEKNIMKQAKKNTAATFDNKKSKYIKKSEDVTEEFKRLRKVALEGEEELLKIQKCSKKIPWFEGLLGNQRKILFNELIGSKQISSVAEFNSFVSKFEKVNITELDGSWIKSIVNGSEKMDDVIKNIDSISSFQKSISMDIAKYTDRKEFFTIVNGADDVAKYYDNQVTQLKALKSFDNFSMKEMKAIIKLHSLDAFKSDAKLFTKLLSSMEELNKWWKLTTKVMWNTDEFIDLLKTEKVLADETLGQISKILKAGKNIKIQKIFKVLVSEESILKTILKLFAKVI